MPYATPRRVDVRLRVPVKIRSLFTKGKGLLQNVSSGGAYIATPMYLLPQARIKLQIVLREERRWVEADAIVVWENRGTVDRKDDLLPGYGVRLISVPHETQQVIDGLLNGTMRKPVSDNPRAFAPSPASAAPPEPDGPAAQPPAARFEAPMLVEEEPSVPPFRLQSQQVHHLAPPEPGIYVLSYDRRQEARIGRADVDLRSTISSFEGEYAYFYCEPIDDLAERYTRECELYHRLGGDRGQLDNDAHPDAPDGVRYRCPVCLHDEVS